MMCDTNDPTIGIKFTCLAIIPRTVRMIDIPTVAPNAPRYASNEIIDDDFAEG